MRSGEVYGSTTCTSPSNCYSSPSPLHTSLYFPPIIQPFGENTGRDGRSVELPHPHHPRDFFPWPQYSNLNFKYCKHKEFTKFSFVIRRQQECQNECIDRRCYRRRQEKLCRGIDTYFDPVAFTQMAVCWVRYYYEIICFI